MLSDDDFRILLDHLDRPWAGFRRVRKGVKKRVRRHMASLGCKGIGDYLDLLGSDAAIRAACDAQLTVTISRFFRDRQLWTHLQERLLPALATRFAEGLHAWSAGCASGEEPYSLAMTWDAMARESDTAPLHILATDADRACLERARAGRYPQSSLREIPEATRHRWFRRIPGTRHVRIADSAGNRIRWQCHQLLDAPPEQKFHLILLRNNLLTYYQGARLKAAFDGIVAHLADGGALVIGAHERLPDWHPPLDRDPLCQWVYRRHGVLP